MSEISLADGSSCFGEQFLHIATPNWPLWIAALLGALLVVRTKEAKGARWFLFGYSAFSFLCVCPGFFFRDHYFIVLLPAVAIFSGAAGSWLLHFAGRWPPGKGYGKRPPTICQHGSPRPPKRSGAGIESGRCRARRSLESCFGRRPRCFWRRQRLVFGGSGNSFSCGRRRGLAKKRTMMNPFVESAVIADYLSRHTTPDQRVAVIGSEPQIYFYAKRRAATGHIYTYPLVEPTTLRAANAAGDVPGNRGGRGRSFSCSFMLICRGWPSPIPVASSISGRPATWKAITVPWAWRTSSRRPGPITSGAIRPRRLIPAHRSTFGSSSERNDRRGFVVRLFKICLQATFVGFWRTRTDYGRLSSLDG